MSGEQNEFAHSSRLPRVDQVVEHPVKRFLSQRRVAGKTSFRVDVHSILHRRSSQHAIFSRQIVGHTLDDDCVAAKREVRTVLLTRPDWYDEARIIAQYRSDLRGVELFDAERSGNRNGGGKSHRISW